MTAQEDINMFKYYLQINHKRKTVESYNLVLNKFETDYAQKPLEEITSDEIFNFLEHLTHNLSKSTRRLRYAQLKAFYNFIIERRSLNMRNPCNMPLLSKAFKAPKNTPHRILEREAVDEMIYNTKRQRDRLSMHRYDNVCPCFHKTKHHFLVNGVNLSCNLDVHSVQTV